MELRGSCHCGNVSFSLDWPGEPAEIPARACGCSFCVKHGGVWTSNPRASLTARIREPAGVVRYAFGTKTAEFVTCARCGVVPFVTSQIGGRTYAVVSVNAFDGIERSRLRIAPASFDGEGVGERLERRARNWIPDVGIEQVDP
jgi:hypothetical protein